jgi:hypothetical protein
MRKRIVLVALFVTLPLAGCASGQQAIFIAQQKDAPVQIVSVVPHGDNLLASVIVKNTTDRYVQDFDITWTIFRPANCAASGAPSPRIGGVMRAAQSVYAEARGTGTLPPGARWGSRVLLPHEQTEITSLSLTRESLRKLAKEYDARKLRAQIGTVYVNFTTGDKFTSRSGPPDWRDENVERTNILDADDAARQACM